VQPRQACAGAADDPAAVAEQVAHGGADFTRTVHTGIAVAERTAGQPDRIRLGLTHPTRYTCGLITAGRKPGVPGAGLPPSLETNMDHNNGQAPWCCDGHTGSCPLCPQYGTRITNPCPGHPYDSNHQTVVDTARLHAERRHPDYEYRTTEGPRKQWDGVDDPPHGDDGEPEPDWERNIDAGRPGMGWDRFDYTEEAYWRRRKRRLERPAGAACAVLHTDDEGNTIPCPGYPHADEGHPEPPSENELDTALPVVPDPRQPAYDAVYEYIRTLGSYLPPDTAHRNAIIWRAVQAALGATPVGRCTSSHCVEDSHITPVETEA